LLSYRFREVRRVRIAPGDVVVLRTAVNLDTETAEKMIADLQQVFPENKVIVLGENSHLEVAEKGGCAGCG
jgi:translation initiation factor IF-1